MIDDLDLAMGPVAAEEINREINRDRVSKLRAIESFKQTMDRLPYAEFSQPNKDTFLTKKVPRLSEEEEHILNLCFEYMDNFAKYTTIAESLVTKDKLTNQECEVLDRYEVQQANAKNIRRLIGILSAKKYAKA